MMEPVIYRPHAGQGVDLLQLRAHTEATDTRNGLGWAKAGLSLNAKQRCLEPQLQY